MIELLDTQYGAMFIPDTDNGQYAWLKNMQASPEFQDIELVCALLDELPIGAALDCGANFGCWALPLSRHATTVLAVEPQRCVYDVLARTIAANPNITNIQAVQLALGPEYGFIKVPDLVMDNTTNFGGVTLGIPHSEHPDAPMYDVPVTPLDELVRKVGIGHVSFIKIDVEGAELGVIQGAEKLIKKFKPIIVAEVDHPMGDTKAAMLLLESFGYNIERLKFNNVIGVPV